MSRYFYVCTALPGLDKNQKPLWSFAQVMDLLTLNLSQSDIRVVKLCNLWSDLINYESMLFGLPTDDFGNLDPQKFDKNLPDHPILFDFIEDYRQHFSDAQEQKEHFAMLYFKFFDLMGEQSCSFLNDYYAFLKGALTVSTTLRAKKVGRDIEKELSHMNKEFPLAMEAIFNRDARVYEPEGPYEKLKDIYEKFFDDPKTQHAAFLGYLFDWIEAKKEGMHWGLDWAVAYLIQLRLLTKMHPGDAKVPLNILEHIGEKAS